jgi:hypothetical protein
MAKKWFVFGLFLTFALRVLPQIRRKVDRYIRQQAAREILEVYEYLETLVGEK